MEVKIDLDVLSESWPSPIVARNRLEVFSGGLITGASMAVFDSRGTGIENRITVNRKTCYQTKDVVAWLKSRIQG
jgi:hypothetical protein